MFIEIKTDDGKIKGKISFYCRVLHVSRQAFNKYLKTKDAPWKYQALADAMLDICSEDECNDTFPAKELFIVSCKKLVLITNQSVSLMALPKLIKKPGNQMI